MYPPAECVYKFSSIAANQVSVFMASAQFSNVAPSTSSQMLNDVEFSSPTQEFVPRLTGSDELNRIADCL